MNEHGRYINLPGPGDEETWGPCIGHPNDPRTVDITETAEFEQVKERIMDERFADLYGWFAESLVEPHTDDSLTELADAIRAGENQRVGDIVSDLCYRHLTPSDEDVIEEMNRD